MNAKATTPILDNSSAPAAVLGLVISKAQSAKDVDSELMAILEKHVLKVDAKETAAQSALSDIEQLAKERASKPAVST